MVDYVDKTRSPERRPSTQSFASRTIAKYSEMGYVADLPRTGQSKVIDEQKLSMLVELENDLHISIRALALHNNVSQNAVVEFFKQEKIYPYKVHLLLEMTEDNLGQRQSLCE
ncbi:hypothetical protein Trydic_g21592 [Trypoxylus dichotomus]